MAAKDKTRWKLNLHVGFDLVRYSFLTEIYYFTPQRVITAKITAATTVASGSASSATSYK